MNKKIRIIIFLLIAFTFSLTIKAQEEILTDQQIVDLTREGLSKKLIIEKIHVSKTNFDISTNAIISLKRAGVDEDVISEMIRATKNISQSAEVKPEPRTEKTTIIEPVELKNPPQPALKTPATINNQPTTNTNTSANNQTQSSDADCLSNQLDPANTTNHNKNICSLVNFIAAENPPEVNLDNSQTLFFSVISGEILKRKKIDLDNDERTQAAVDFFLQSDKSRIDKQVGSNPDSSGTTSLVVKGGAPSAIGWAIESGAATSSVDGNTVTIKVNPFGLARALQGEGFLGTNLLNNLVSTRQKATTNPDLSYSNFLRKFSLGFSFDTTRGRETPALVVSKQQLSAVSARYEFINQRTPQSRYAREKFLQFVPDVSNIITEQANLENSFRDQAGNLVNKALKDSYDSLNSDLSKVKPAQAGNLIDKQRYKKDILGIVLKWLENLPVDKILEDPNTKQSAQRYIELTLDYADKRKKFIEEVNKGRIVTFEYTNGREPVAPDTSNFRFIYEDGRFFKGTDVTFNASLTIYNKKPAFMGVKRLRDFQFALQTETKLNDTFGTGRTTLTFAGRYERLNGNTVDKVTGIVTPGTKGDIAVGQIKFTIPIADLGIKLPLSISFANRSEFIKESHVRANFGFTFDLDPIFARLKPF